MAKKAKKKTAKKRSTKKAKGGGGKSAKAKKAAESADVPDVISFSKFGAERVLASQVPEPGSEDRQQAQDLAYQAMEADDPDVVADLAMQALAVYPYCVDALSIVAELSAESDEDYAAMMRMVVEIAEHELGPEWFEQYRGEFWSFLETRPYMRARHALAGALMRIGDRRGAIKEMEGMLDLNPEDNQGVRYPLLGCYLEEGDLESARELFERYDEEWSAMFAWAKVLERFLAGDEKGATKALAEARSVNPHVEAYLTGKKRLPKNPPAYYGPGDPDEAYVCKVEIGFAWESHPEAIRWLKRVG
ncbi:MAG: tetratricopeptide repeat protein [Planctomycetota bacterium]|nr:MAG: tetratricopeptide repeat protein [Planctomycetota bacterium]